MNALLTLLRTLDRVVSLVARSVSVFCLAAIFVLFLANIFVRFVPIYNFMQTDDWIQIFLVWMIFPGAMELVRTRSHFMVDVLTERIAGTQTGRIRGGLVVIEEDDTLITAYRCGTFNAFYRDPAKSHPKLSRAEQAFVENYYANH